MELAYRLAVDDSAYIRSIRDHVITLITPIVEVDGRDRMVDHLPLAPGQPRQAVAAAHLLGPLRGARQQSRRHGAHPAAHPQRPQHLRGLEGAGAPRPARVRAVPLRQHRRRRPLQRLDRPDAGRRVADDGLEQRLRDDQVRHARRLHARHLRHLVAQLPDVHRRHAQRHQPPLRNLRQRRRRHRRAHPAPQRVRPHLVQTESAAAQSQMVAARQQQLRRDRPAHRARLLRRQQQALPAQLLPQGQALH